MILTYRYSSHFKHILYDSATFDGDCGSALVLHDGKVLGLHVEGINQLKERISRNKSVRGRLVLRFSHYCSYTCETAGLMLWRNQWILLCEGSLMGPML